MLARLARALAALVAVTSAAPLAAETIVLRDVAIVDVASGKVTRKQSIIVEGRTIRAVGPTRRVKAPRGSRIMDGGGRYAIPGLWDMGSFVLDGMKAAPGSMELMIAHGVVGTRDLNTGMPAGEVKSLIASIERGSRVGPKLLWTTRALWRSLRPGPPLPDHRRVDIADEAAVGAAVDAAAREGVDSIRVVQNLPEQWIPAAVAAAKRHRLPVTGAFVHGYKPAVEAGVELIEHFVDLYRSTPRRPERDDYVRIHRDDSFRQKVAGSRDTQYAFFEPFRRLRDEAYYRETIAAIARADVPVTTAMATMFWAQQMHAARFAERGRYARPAAPLPPPPPTAVKDQSRDGLWADLRDLRDGGVPLIAGTQAYGAREALPGATLHDELEILTKAGFTPREALAMATVTPAKVIARLFPRVRAARAVAAGEPADLVLLDADPLSQITNTRRIHAVVADGRWFGPAERQALLDKAIELAATASASGEEKK